MTDYNLLVRNVVASRLGGMVERCHGIPHHGTYSNAQHQWGVAMLYLYLWPNDPQLSLALTYCLVHDVPEAWVGDVPAPTMRYVPWLKDTLGRMEDDLLERFGLPRLADMPKDMYERYKACDRLELFMWCYEQAEMGNRFAEECRVELVRYLEEANMPAEARAFMEEYRSAKKIAPQAGVMKELCEK